VYQPLDASACDDQNACTGDTCDPTGGCVHTYLTAKCSDDNPCTQGDQCKFGTCKGDAVDCDDAKACTDDACDKAAKGCVHLPNAATCSDGSLCTAGDVCSLGACKAGAAANCDDANPCTSDACAANIGCIYGFSPGKCEDGNSCTAGDACKDGACQGAVKVCDDGNPCSNDGCDPKAGCTATPNTAPCSDGNACTAGDTCKDGACTVGKVAVCDDGNPCTDDGCDPKSGCATAANTAACDDGNTCTLKDTCKGGACAGVASCNDNNPCTDDGCDGGQCAHLNNANPCSDGNACTTGDKCAASKCAGTGKLSCDDQNVCTDDACDAANGCVHTSNAQPCDDLNACTASDACKAGLCQGVNKTCDDGNPCTDDACDLVKGCASTSNTAGCNDNDPCTVGDACATGKCAPGKAKDCADSSVCTVDSCNPATGQCSQVDTSSKTCDDGNPCTDDGCHPALGCGHVNNKAPCSDGNPCTTGDGCQSGKCGTTGVLDCNDAKPCTDDTCDPKQGCVNAHNTKPCDDGAACTKADACKGGSCVGMVDCDDGLACTADACDPKTGDCVSAPIPTGQPCDDGDKCTAESVCKDGACAATKPVVCNDGNACTDDACYKDSGCKTFKNALFCEAGGCTGGDQCKDGTCVASKTERFGRWEFPDTSVSAEVEFKDIATIPGGGWLVVGTHTVEKCGQFGCSTGDNANSFYARINENGVMAWKVIKEYGGGAKNVKDALRRVVRTPDGKLFAVGTRVDPVAGQGEGSQGHLMLLDPAKGAVTASWGLTLNQSTQAQFVDSALAVVAGLTGDPNALLIAGTTTYPDAGTQRNLLFWSFAGSGLITTAGLYTEAGDQVVADMLPLEGGQYAVLDSTDSPTTLAAAEQTQPMPALGKVDGRVLVLDSALKLVRILRFGTANNDTPTGFLRMPDGGFLVAFYHDVPGAYLDGVIRRLSKDGAVLWSKVLGGYYGERTGRMRWGQDGMAHLVGGKDPGAAGPKAAHWRFDTEGNLLSEAAAPNAWGHTLDAVLLMPDDSVVGAGRIFGGAGLIHRYDPWSAATCAGSGICWNKAASHCDDGEACTSPKTCDGKTGQCAQLMTTGECSDGDACTGGEACSSGKCLGAAPINCDDKNACTSDNCDKIKGCVHGNLADGFACADGKKCAAGVCQ